MNSRETSPVAPSRSDLDEFLATAPPGIRHRLQVIEEEDDQEEESLGNQPSTNKMMIEETLNHLGEILQDKIAEKERRSAPNVPTKPLRALRVVFQKEGTWLENPKVEQGSKDTVGVWPANTRFPQNERYGGPDARFGVPETVPTKFEDAQSEAFLKGPSLVRNGKIALNDCFNKLEMKIPGSNTYHTIDILTRKALIQNCTAESFSSTAQGLLGQMIDDIQSDQVTDVKSLIPHLTLAKEVATLATMAAWKSSYHVAAACAANKIGLRDSVLNKCSGDQSTKDLMRRSNLCTPYVFGEIPESLQNRVGPGSSTAKDFQIIVPKEHSGSSGQGSTGASTSSPKRSFFERYIPNKKIKLDYSRPYPRTRPEENFRQRVQQPQGNHKSKGQARFRKGASGSK